MNMNLSSRFQKSTPVITLLLLAVLLLWGDVPTLSARPIPKSKGSQTPQRFVRQKNNLSNVEFYFTNKGVLFNNDNVAGLQWPRGTSNSYIYGGGIWFATKKVIGGKRRKLVELGYNPNSGAGWYAEGESGMDVANRDSKFGSYVSSRYDGNKGIYNGNPNITSLTKPFVPWPIWDTSLTKKLNKNYYFGDYISDVALRIPTTLSNGHLAKPSILSQEDIVNIYTDIDVSNNPEFRPNTGYPFGLNIVEVIYSWSFGRYRDMLFVRHHITNASKDVLYECFMSPAFDPDLGVGGNAAANDKNQYVGSDSSNSPKSDFNRAKRVLKGTCYEKDPKRLNMAFQQSGPEGGKAYGVIGFAFLESPATNPKDGVALDNSDSVAVSGYGLPESHSQLGLTTFKKWTLSNDPSTPDLRYDFVSDGSKDGDGGIVGDMRLLFATGPFTLLPGKSVETVVAIGIAQASTTDNEKNIDSVFKLMAFAHEVFGGDCYTHFDTIKTATDTTVTSVIKHFITPVPPDIPILTAKGLDRAVYLSWTNTSDSSKDPLSSTLAFNEYDLYRTTRSDLDSTIRPDGNNPTVKLGSWTIWDFKQDSVFDGSKKFVGFKQTRTNTVPKKIPHSFLDLGDDNKDGIVSGSEGLFNGVKYYYFLTATDEFDSANKVGPLTTAVVSPKNLVVGIPAKPVFPDMPPSLAVNNNCFSGADLVKTPKVGGIKDVGISITDTGKFVELFSNDTILVSFQPRWTEYVQNSLDQSPLNMFVDVRDQRQGIEYTYEILNDPKSVPTYTPYSFQPNSGIRQSVIGQNADSNVTGKFTTDNSKFAPFQRVYQAFSVQADYDFAQLKEKYHLNSIKLGAGTKGDLGMIHLSQRTVRAKDSVGPIDLNNIPVNATNPTFQGSLGEVDYEITFGDPVDNFSEVEYDSVTHTTSTITNLHDANANVDYKPRPLPITIRSITHCNEPLRLIRPGNRSDITVEGDYRYYADSTFNTQQPDLFFPKYDDPDTLVTPNPGWFAVDAYHFTDDDSNSHSSSAFFLKTTGNYYYPYSTEGGGKFRATVHRIRLGGAEIILNRPSIQQPGVTGDIVANGTQLANDFAPGDKIIVSFGGLMRGLPFPGSVFKVPTSPSGTVDFAGAGLYEKQNILDQVQVVPNPYIVTHIGQSSTDNAKLFFTRLPPRATIEIYTLAGDLVKTIEHVGYSDTSAVKDQHLYNYNSLADRYNVEEWNLLSEGRQRVGSQVLIARVLARDPYNGDRVIGETTVKFAVVLGGFRQVR